MGESRNRRRRREDTWDDDAPSASDHGPPAFSVDGTVQVEPLREMAMPAGPTTRRRREDIWETEMAALSDSDPIINAQDGPAQQTSVDLAELSNSSGALSWDEILSSGDTPTAPRASSPPEQVRLPRFQEAPQQAAPFEPESARPSVPQRTPPALPQPDSLPLPQRPGHGVDRGPRFQPYQAPPIPESLDEVRIPDRAELAAMEKIHGRPERMSESIFHHFRRGYGVPPYIAFGMRAQSMIGVYQSGLVYLDYERLAAIPAQWHRSSGAEIPARYWVRILTVKQGPHREHIEHMLSKAPGPCRCHNCQYDRQHGMMTRRGGR